MKMPDLLYKQSKSLFLAGARRIESGYALFRKASKNIGSSKTVEFKKPKSKISGKEGAKNAPSWAKVNKPYKHESGKDLIHHWQEDIKRAKEFKEIAEILYKNKF